MKTDQGVLAQSAFNDEDLAQFVADNDNVTIHDLQNAYFQELKVRIELRDALGSLNASMRALMGLIGRHNFITAIPESAIPKYEEVMHTIGAAVFNASKAIEKSRILDENVAMNMSNFSSRTQ